MQKNYAIAAIGAICAIFTAYSYSLLNQRRHLDSEIKKLETQMKADEKRHSDEEKMLKQLADDQARLQANAARTSQELSNRAIIVQQDLTREKSVLQGLIQQRQVLLSQPHQQEIADYSEKIAQENRQLKDATDKLAQLQNADKGVKSGDNDQLVNAQNQVKNQNQIIQDSINTQKAAIAATQQQIVYWKTQRGDPTQPSQLQALQNQLANQRAALATTEADAQLTHQQQNQAIAALKANNAGDGQTAALNESQLKQQIAAFKADIDALNKKKAPLERSAQDVRNQIQQIDASIKLSQARIAGIDQNLSTIQLQLKAASQPKNPIPSASP